MHPPVAWTLEWSRENPKQAFAVLLFGVCMIGFTIWIVVSGP